jgi:hypothetical protein
MVKLMTGSPLISMPVGSFTYCMYAHPWAFDERKGDLMITWSEGGISGSVVVVYGPIIQTSLCDY